MFIYSALCLFTVLYVYLQRFMFIYSALCLFTVLYVYLQCFMFIYSALFKHAVSESRYMAG